LLQRNNMRLYIKHMVSLRCKMIVKQQLNKLGIKCSSLDLGSVEISEAITEYQHDHLQINLQKLGLELLDSKENILTEKIKNVIVDMIHFCDKLPGTNYSDYISKKLDYNYPYLANVFSKNRGGTIEQFIISHKIEKVKELLLYNELNLTEIAFKLHYSSVAHLSNQFKKVTGLSPCFYKQSKEKRTCNLENV
ncbi:MAG: helix-turn-helix domain-containing protein, partial [Cytophagales bacterium]